MVPLASTGGLGDVVGGLAPALAKLGCRVSVALPSYRSVRDAHETRAVARNVPVRLAFEEHRVDFERLVIEDDTPVYLVRNDRFFDRGGLYSDIHGLFGDNHLRYMLFSRAVCAMCQTAAPPPDVILANDWQTGLTMALLDYGFLPRTAGVFTIHNLGYLGLVSAPDAGWIDLPNRYLGMDGLEFWGSFSLIKAGIAYADAVVTVSPTYAREIRTPEQGAGLDGLLRSRGNELFGILNGMDMDRWNPATDKALAANYSPEDLAGKRRCKLDLLKSTGLPEALADRPLLGLVSRLVTQKGMDLLAMALPGLLDAGMGMVLLGDGDPRFHAWFSDIAARFPGRFALHLGFDPVLARKVFAGADIFVMPSLYEPCGLAQMYAMRYGTIPVVRATGGLSDTVLDTARGAPVRTGFVFEGYSSADLADAVKRAAEAYGDPRDFRNLMLRAMSASEAFTWENSARQYMAVFERAVSRRRGGDNP